jgi:hypothetical protein
MCVAGAGFARDGRAGVAPTIASAFSARAALAGRAGLADPNIFRRPCVQPSAGGKIAAAIHPTMSTYDDKLAALRAKYANASSGETFDARFKAVAERIFSGSGTRLAPNAGVATLLAAPHMPLALGDPAFSALQVALIGVPMDLGVTNRPGARFGPRAPRP